MQREPAIKTQTLKSNTSFRHDFCWNPGVFKFRMIVWIPAFAGMTNFRTVQKQAVGSGLKPTPTGFSVIARSPAQRGMTKQSPKSV
jgi:hypothetical protein